MKKRVTDIVQWNDRMLSLISSHRKHANTLILFCTEFKKQANKVDSNSGHWH